MPENNEGNSINSEFELIYQDSKNGSNETSLLVSAYRDRVTGEEITSEMLNRLLKHIESYNEPTHAYMDTVTGKMVTSDMINRLSEFINGNLERGVLEEIKKDKHIVIGYIDHTIPKSKKVDIQINYKTLTDKEVEDIATLRRNEYFGDVPNHEGETIGRKRTVVKSVESERKYANHKIQNTNLEDDSNEK